MPVAMAAAMSTPAMTIQATATTYKSLATQHRYKATTPIPAVLGTRPARPTATRPTPMAPRPMAICGTRPPSGTGQLAQPVLAQTAKETHSIKAATSLDVFDKLNCIKKRTQKCKIKLKIYLNILIQ